MTAVGGAEDPEKILDQAVNEMQSDLIKMRQSSAQARLQFTVASSARSAWNCQDLSLIQSSSLKARFLHNAELFF